MTKQGFIRKLHRPSTQESEYGESLLMLLFLLLSAWERTEKFTRLWWERDHSEDEDVDGSMGLGDRLGGGCFMLGTAARLLCTR